MGVHATPFPLLPRSARLDDDRCSRRRLVGPFRELAEQFGREIVIASEIFGYGLRLSLLLLFGLKAQTAKRNIT